MLSRFCKNLILVLLRPMMVTLAQKLPSWSMSVMSILAKSLRCLLFNVRDGILSKHYLQIGQYLHFSTQCQDSQAKPAGCPSKGEINQSPVSSNDYVDIGGQLTISYSGDNVVNRRVSTFGGNDVVLTGQQVMSILMLTLIWVVVTIS